MVQRDSDFPHHGFPSNIYCFECADSHVLSVGELPAVVLRWTGFLCYKNGHLHHGAICHGLPKQNVHIL